MDNSTNSRGLRGAAIPAGSLRRLRAMLLGTATFGALCLPAGPASAACVAGPANVLTCTGGDLTAGISATAPIDTLNVNGVTANIAPAAGTDGIDFSNAAAISYTGNTGASSIITTGAGIGIDLESSGASIAADHTGNVTSAAIGVQASAATTLDLTTSGNISGALTAIDADSVGAMTLISTGTLTSSAGFGIDADTSGAGGNIIITSTGNITGNQGAISATAADGVISITSSGALVSAAGHGIAATTASAGDHITIDQTGNVSASGANSGIRAEAAGGGNIGITISSGTITGGALAGAAGITFVDGGTNTLSNSGTVGATDRFAVIGGTGDEVITNNATGILIGDIDLNGGTNSLINAVGGQVRSGGVLSLGAGNVFVNNGILRPGNNDAIQSTALTGDLLQSNDGSIGIDLNTRSGLSDVVNVDGDAALDGAIAPNIMDRSLTVKSFTILTTSGTLTDSGLIVADTAAYDYSLTFDVNDLVLNVRLAAISPLVASPLTGNQLATVTYLDAILDDPGISPAMVLFLDTIGGLPTEAGIINALDRLNPQHYIGSVGATLQGSQFLVGSLMSCPTGEGAIGSEGQCFWAQLKGRHTEWDRTQSNIGGKEDIGGFAGGAQGRVASNWLLGGAISLDHSTTETNNLASSDGNHASGGMVLKGVYGDTTLAGAVYGGIGWYDTTRVVMPAVTANADHDVSFGGTGLRLSHAFEAGGWYAKPMLDAGATYMSYGDITETGAGVANLIVDGENEWVLNAGLAVEFGGRMVIQDKLLVRPFVRAGVIALSESEFSLTSRFAGAPPGVGDFTVTTAYDDILADIGAGLDLYAINAGLSVTLNYDGKLGDNTATHAGSAKLRMMF